MSTATTLDIKHVVVGPAEQEAVLAALTSGNLSGNACAVAQYENALSAWFTSPHAVACSSGTAAIHLALLALGVGPGDEVIVSAAAPAMTALPVLAVGASPVIADVAHPATFALDRDDVASKITGRTRAVVTVPMWGYPADGADLAAACERWGLPLIEDAAQAHGTIVDGRRAGTHGTIGTFSTHVRKIMTTGEGGFCLTGDNRLNEQLRQIRNLGQPQGGAFGTSFGLNLKLPAMSAALGTAQLTRLTRRIESRLENLAVLNALVLANKVNLTPFPVRESGKPNGYAALFTSARAAEIAARLADAGIVSDPQRYGYRPVYHAPALAAHAPKRPCANAEQLAQSLVTLPCHEGVALEQLVRIEVALGG